jgi:Ca-activated chloride channel family protein
MNPQTRISRSIAALALLLGASACSGVALEDQSAADDVGDDVGGSDDESDGDDSTTESGDDESDSGTDTGTEGDDEDTGPTEGSGDPQLGTDACDAEQDHVIAYDLAEAHAEIAPELVRESVMTHAIVPQIPLSPRPFLNHFHFDHPAAIDSTLAITGELWKAQSELELELPRYQLQFAVSGPTMLDDQRPLVDLAVVVDIGPSMVGLPLALADEALAAVSASLRNGDRITLISAGDQAQLLGSMIIEAGVEPSLPSMLSEIPQAGAAAIGEGLQLAYAQLAELDPLPDAQPRVMLISAGHFVADAAMIELVDSQAEFGVSLTSVGVGAPDQFVESSLRSLAMVGKGASVYAPNVDQLWLGLGEQFTAKMITSAFDVEVELVLPPGLAISERDPSWGTELAAEFELASLGPNDSLVFHQELVACAELDLAATIRVVVEWNEPGLAETQELTWELPVAELGFGAMLTRKGAAVLAYTDALIAYRDNVEPGARYGALLDALGHISKALESMPYDADLIEMSEVLAKLEGV